MRRSAGGNALGESGGNGDNEPLLDLSAPIGGCSVTEEKNCTRCGERKPIDDFYMVSRKLGTYRGQCKPCVIIMKKMRKDPAWRPDCSGCGRRMERFGPGRRLCQKCFDAKYERERRENGSHNAILKPCSACGYARLRADHLKGSSLCPICRSVPQSRRKRLKEFNMTPRMYVTILEDQGYCCWICQRPFTKARPPNIDHQHRKPMIVRGLICGTDNAILGLAKDDPDRLRGAAKFLESPPVQYMYPGLVASAKANRPASRYIPLRRSAQ